MTSPTQPRRSPRKNFWTTGRMAFTFLVLALVAAFGASSCNPAAEVAKNNQNAAQAGGNGGGAATAAGGPAVPAALPPLPANLMTTELKTIDGKSVKLADYAGKVVVVNLWATWCGPCRIEIPHLIDIANEYKGRVELIGLTNEDPVGDAEKVNEFVREQKINYTIGWATQEFALGLMQGQVRNSIPQSFVISREGRVVKRFVGFSPVQTPPQMRQAVEQAVNEKSGA
ncbi:MAG TPA: TlpA disulfide reductase family protein [Pyrinomonadaceae bacterium]|nr:TlpA disulfide reductase family protein [Pyrinomonadaceae bacterium]